MNAQLFHHRIIQSALDLDVYKINMMQAAHRLYPEAHVRYELIVRSDEDLSDLINEVRAEIAQLANCTFSEADIQYLTMKAPHLSEAFLDYLRYFRFMPQQHICVDTIRTLKGKKQLRVSIAGSWKDTILYETLVMSIISEVRNRRRWDDIPYKQFMSVLKDKVQRLKAELSARHITNFRFSEMGSRRRFSYQTQHDMLDYLRQEIPELLSGTSNYHLAREFDLTPIGTVAHEWFMAHQAMVNVRDSQRVAIDNWHHTFDGALGIALTDTIGIDAFLQDFNLRRAQAYAGVRHDSGSPFDWGDKMIAHYQKLGIDPMSKMLIFTDGLNFDRALEICEYFAGRAQISFGIGTFLANDMGEWQNRQGEIYEPLSMVVKMAECNGSPVAKISDEPEKAMCEDLFFLMNLKQRFGLPVDLDKAIGTLKSMKISQHKFQSVA
ncbi:nicotinate phosphoribosyltransferase [Vibrio sp. V39_P1S14PM300]|uniref:nicotinate phosphoribosyltransferase n=1 Tax=Vibrio sp. V39_P1S14PM300 TaxID=1938690 RepID=UPI0013730AE1|nr:nicotinate phosphoribosyltransferase [Vibrio sp. V39_P1S14PM300]NAX20165.1 nicotinate phosphoribosyltransferase [Vibrio sp. V39_P1S14PM300]